jgi:hypothetical protein
LRARADATGKPVVLLHIGEPKTGTTFLQDAMWANRAALRAQGVTLPGLHAYDQYRASRDLRQFRYDGTHPRGSWVGEWDILAEQARRCDGVAVISHEILMAAKPEQIARAVGSLEPAELHIAVTVRDLASLLPAAWQEAVKNGETGAWDDWVRDVIDRQSKRRSAQRRGFWRLHDTVPTLRKWAAHVPFDRMHVVTVPPSGSPRDLLWQRWADLLGYDPTGTEVGGARENTSLGWPEAEFLRAVNTKLRGQVPHWMYETYIKPTFAESMLSTRPRTSRPALSDEAATWVDGYTLRRGRSLRTLGVDLRGDLADLERRPGNAGGTREIADRELVAVGVDAVAQLLAERREHPIEKRAQPRPQAGWVDRAVDAAMPSNRLKKSLRELSVRYRWIGRLRVAVWRLSNRG